MKKPARILTCTISLLFVFPAIIALVAWLATDRPESWRTANWGSSGLLEPAQSTPEATVHVLAARTGGLKGALSVHSWLVIKPAGAIRYIRYDKVGWGTPVKRNAFEPDGRWYSNEPFIVAEVRGTRAEALIPDIERAIASYPFNRHGGYRIWPGPNSNSFVAHVLRQVPEIGATLPTMAVGRDYPTNGWLRFSVGDLEMRVNLFGLAGFAVGLRSGLEFQFLGLVAGLRWSPFDVDLPGLIRSGSE